MEDNPWCICTSKMVSKGVNHPPQNWPLCLWLSPPPPHDYFKPPLSHCNYDKALWPCLLLPQVPSSKSPRQAIHLPPGLTNSPRLPQHTNQVSVMMIQNLTRCHGKNKAGVRCAKRTRRRSVKCQVNLHEICYGY